MKIRCAECGRLLTIDEAFAGGVCRCPHCKATVFVPGQSDASEGQVRPEAPRNRGAVPETPEETPPASAPQNDTSRQVARAHPVKFRGILAVFLMVVLLAMLGAGIAVAVSLMKGADGTDADKTQIAPAGSGQPGDALEALRQRGPIVAENIPIVQPVTYCIDGGASMGAMFDVAVMMTKASVATLEKGDRFDVLLCLAAGNRKLGGGIGAGGTEARDAIMRFVKEWQYKGQTSRGASDVAAALREAIDGKPGTIVLFVSGKDVADPDSLARLAEAAGVAIVAIELDTDSPARDGLAKLAGASGKAVNMTRAEVERWLEDHPQD